MKNILYIVKDFFSPRYGNSSRIFFDTSNGGVPRYGAEIDKLTTVVPTTRQLLHATLGYYNFIHFGINTFYEQEWGNGKEDTRNFYPRNLNTDKWCEILSASGSKGIILTAKHHDGFCLFPSAYTEHCVKNSPYRNGNGDIVWELSQSCKKYGLKFGIYLSPWDRHEKSYGKNAYNDYYVCQLKELLGGKYGEIFCLWCDGARGKDATLDEDFDYDWKRITQTVRTLQPDCLIAIMGEDIRWIGNEGAKTRKEEWSVVPKRYFNYDTIAQNSQTDEKAGEKMKKFDEMSADLGSRKVILSAKERMWYPAEADVSIRKGWFYHANEKPKSVRALLKIYLQTVGKNASLLLNVPPDKNGEIDSKDEKVLRAFGKEVRKLYEKEVPCTFTFGRDERKISSAERLSFLPNENLFDIVFDRPRVVRTLVLSEDIRFSQRVEKFEIFLRLPNGKYLKKGRYAVIGARRIISLQGITYGTGLRFVLLQSRNDPVFSSVKVYE